MSGKKKTPIFTVCAIKGGVSKTTTIVTLAHAAIIEGKKSLLVDLDAEANASIWLNSDLSRPGSYDLLTGAGEPAKTIQRTDSGVDVIAGSANLATLKTGPGSAERLRNALQPILRQYDLVCIDTAPQMGEAQNNALNASTGLIIPLTASSLSLQAFYQITDIARHVQQNNSDLSITGVIISQFDSRPKINRFMRDTIKEKAAAAGIPFLTEIRAGVAVREAEAMRQPLLSYSPKSKPAEDYLKLYKMIMEG